MLSAQRINLRVTMDNQTSVSYCHFKPKFSWEIDHVVCYRYRAKDGVSVLSFKTSTYAYPWTCSPGCIAARSSIPPVVIASQLSVDLVECINGKCFHLEWGGGLLCGTAEWNEFFHTIKTSTPNGGRVWLCCGGNLPKCLFVWLPSRGWTAEKRGKKSVLSCLYCPVIK